MSFLAGGPLAFISNLIAGPIVGAVLDGYKARLEAGSKADTLATELAGKDLALQAREEELRTQLLIAEQGSWVTRIIRPLWALPFIGFTWKVVVYDKMLGWGTTDALDPKMWSIFMLMVGAYFGGRSLEKVATTVAGALKRK